MSKRWGRCDSSARVVIRGVSPSTHATTSDPIHEDDEELIKALDVLGRFLQEPESFPSGPVDPRRLSRLDVVNERVAVLFQFLHPSLNDVPDADDSDEDIVVEHGHMSDAMVCHYCH